MRRTTELVFNMINAGELTVAEARQELATGIGSFDREAAALLAGWIMDREDQGEHWQAGDPESLPCGCVVSYDRTQVGSKCDGSFRFGCQLDRVLVEACC